MVLTDKSFNSIFLPHHSVELFKQYVTPKDGPDAPKQFVDCAKLYSECKAPNEHSVGVNKRRRVYRRKNQTTTPAYEEETTNEVDPITQYVQKKK